MSKVGGAWGDNCLLVLTVRIFTCYNVIGD